MHPHGNTKAMKKEKADLKALKKIAVYCKRYLFAIIVALIFAVGGSVATIIGPEKIGELMNLLTEGIIVGVDMSAFVEICIMLIIIYATGAVLSYGQQFIMATVTQKTGKRLRRDIDCKINKIPLNYFDTTTKGDMLSVVTNDVE